MFYINEIISRNQRERKREETLIIIQLYPSLVLSITALIPPPPPISPPLYLKKMTQLLAMKNWQVLLFSCDC